MHLNQPVLLVGTVSHLTKVDFAIIHQLIVDTVGLRFCIRSCLQESHVRHGQLMSIYMSVYWWSL